MICHYRNEEGTGIEVRPAIVSGIVTGIVTGEAPVQEAFAKVNSAQFLSRHGAHASLSSFGSGIHFAAIGSESQMFFRTYLDSVTGQQLKDFPPLALVLPRFVWVDSL